MTEPKYFPFYASCCKQTRYIIYELESALWHRLPAVTVCVCVCVFGLTVSDCGNTVCVRFQGFCSDLLHIHRLLSICNNGFQAAERRLLMFISVSMWEDLTQTLISDLCRQQDGGWKLRQQDIVCFQVSGSTIAYVENQCIMPFVSPEKLCEVW